MSIIEKLNDNDLFFLKNNIIMIPKSFDEYNEILKTKIKDMDAVDGSLPSITHFTLKYSAMKKILNVDFFDHFIENGDIFFNIGNVARLFLKYIDGHPNYNNTNMCNDFIRDIIYVHSKISDILNSTNTIENSISTMILGSIIDGTIYTVNTTAIFIYMISKQLLISEYTLGRLYSISTNGRCNCDALLDALDYITNDSARILEYINTVPESEKNIIEDVIPPNVFSDKNINIHDVGIAYYRLDDGNCYNIFNTSIEWDSEKINTLDSKVTTTLKYISNVDGCCMKLPENSSGIIYKNYKDKLIVSYNKEYDMIVLIMIMDTGFYLMYDRTDSTSIFGININDNDDFIEIRVCNQHYKYSFSAEDIR